MVADFGEEEAEFRLALMRRAVIELPEVEFSALDIKVQSGSDCFVTIKPKWNDFGLVAVHENHGELIVNWGRLAHSHIDSYEENQEEHLSEIVDQLRHQVGHAVADNESV